ncbi:M20 family metallopeptidase [Nakamurella sp. A5-74]|uniref:Probable succinyl-diaminopimelate desuccinylase n=1 Tax=Nakamurella sp. A5-74 TaxID=3158264 RepID=A0AAU8DJY9_9ACTN
MTQQSPAQHVEPDTAAAVALTQELVRLRTVNARDAVEIEAPAARVVESVMRGFGWDVSVQEVAPGRPNVVGVITGTSAGRTLMFEGHTDVVTEGDPAAWSFDPFSGDIVDGRLLGRGSADMKAGVAAMIHAARAVELGGFRGRIIVGALCDEEEMMIGATAFAASPLAAGVDGVIVCEPEEGEICAISKGAMRVRIGVLGKMAHGAMPQHGRNPIPAVGRILLGLQELGEQIAAGLGSHEYLGEFYLTPTVVQAGTIEQINVIPAVASIAVDIRSIPGADHGAVVHLIRRLTEQITDEAGLGSKIEVLVDRPVVDTPHGAPVVAALAAAHLDITGQQPVFGGVPGTTDGTILSRDAGLSTVVYGPGGKWIAHQVDEFVAVSQIEEATRVYARAAQLFLAEET